MENKRSCIIVEDLAVAANFLRRCCEESGKLELLAVFSNVEEALAFLEERRVDLIFLDVELPGSTGFDLLDRLSFSPRIILTTSKPEYAYDGFRYRVDDFLKKPFSFRRFMEVMERLEERTALPPAGTAGHFFIRVDHKLVKLSYDEILFVESMGDYVRFVTPERKLLTLSTLKNVEERLDPARFAKVHRSFIVNLARIDDLHGNLILIQKHEIPLGKAYRDEVLRRLNIL